MNDKALLDAQFLKSCAQLDQLPPAALPEIAFAGRSNAGKSSALNRLCQRKGLARTSKTPGRTQLLNYFTVPGGHLVDLPGYGFARVPEAVRRNWGALVGGYVQQRDCLVGVVVVMDIRHPLTEGDVQMIEWAQAAGRRVHVLLTKADKLSRGKARGIELTVQRELGDHASAQCFSAMTGAGLDVARQRVSQWLAVEVGGEAAPE